MNKSTSNLCGTSTNNNLRGQEGNFKKEEQADPILKKKKKKKTIRSSKVDNHNKRGCWSALDYTAALLSPVNM